ncbi:hypothetical protein BGZ83_005344 [Gryganskiella cystojenkinii]|nr:hypothetical protein BGZ83_005344 [Gryganskiella cystojenkinii]
MDVSNPPIYAQQVTSSTTSPQVGLEMMVSDIDQTLLKISELLKEVTLCDTDGSGSVVPEIPFQRLNMTELYDTDKKTCRKDLQDERRLLLDQRQRLKVRIVELAAQEHQKALDYQIWYNQDKLLIHRLQSLEDSIQRTEGFLFSLGDISMNGKLFITDSRLKTLFTQTVITATADGGHSKTQPFMKFYPYTMSTQKLALQELSRLSQEHSAVMQYRTRPPPAPQGTPIHISNVVTPTFSSSMVIIYSATLATIVVTGTNLGQTSHLSDQPLDMQGLMDLQKFQPLKMQPGNFLV